MTKSRISETVELFMFHLVGDLQFHRETRALGAGFEPQLSAITSQNCTRHIHAKPARSRAILKWLKQPLRLGDPRPGVLKMHHGAFLLNRYADLEFPKIALLHGPIAVLRDIQERLEQSMSVRQHPWHLLGKAPTNDPARFYPIRFDHNPKIVENLLQRHRSQ